MKSTILSKQLKIRPTVVFVMLGLLTFFILGLLPMFIANRNANQELETLTVELQKRNIILPIYARVSKIISKFDKQYKIKGDNTLPISDIPLLSKTLISLAEDQRLAVSLAAPDPRSLDKESSNIAVDIELLGELSDFRKFLLELAALPYLVKFEKIRIIQTSSGKKYFLKFWLALKK